MRARWIIVVPGSDGRSFAVPHGFSLRLSRCCVQGCPNPWLARGGWGYFAGGLDVYAQAFHFVEVNATFYRRIPDAMARRWRSRAPVDFVFSVKVHREVTHRDNLRASKGARESFAASARTARILGGPFLIP